MSFKYRTLNESLTSLTSSGSTQRESVNLESRWQVRETPREARPAVITTPLTVVWDKTQHHIHGQPLKTPASTSKQSNGATSSIPDTDTRSYTPIGYPPYPPMVVTKEQGKLHHALKIIFRRSMTRDERTR